MRILSIHVALLLICCTGCWQYGPAAAQDTVLHLLERVLACDSPPPPPGTTNNSTITVFNLVPQDIPSEALTNSSVQSPLPQRRGTGGTITPTNVCNSGTFDPVSNATLYNTYPFFNMGKFYFTLSGSLYACSAMLLAPNLMLTAVHCVYDCNTFTQITSGTFYDRFYQGEYAQFAKATTVAFYRQCDSSGIPLYDFAVTRLDTCVLPQPLIPPALCSHAPGHIFSLP